METLTGLLDAPDAQLSAIEAHLDALDEATRIKECRALSGKQQARLYQLAATGTPLTIAAMLLDAKEDQTVRFAGKNSLAAFSHFEKHFARHGGEAVGINVQSMSFATGPGYFTCADGVAERPTELLFDYTRVPTSAPPGWPKPRSNAGGLSSLVYKNLQDYNRRVGKHVVIGSATRLGKPLNNFYVLARAGG